MNLRSLTRLTFLAGALFLIPLTALAQDVTPPAADDTGLAFPAIVLVGVGVKMIVDWIKTAIPAISGVVTNLVATALAYGATYIQQVGTFTDWVSRLNTALIIAGTSSLVAEGYRMLKARQTVTVVDV